MTDKSGYGYSTRIVQLNRRADARKNVGVQLGRRCIRNNIPVASIADELGVSRQTVYNWFSGVTEPTNNMREKIKLLSLVTN